MDAQICAKKDIPERRRTPRMPYRTNAHYESASAHGVGTTQNLSPDGMFLEPPVPLDVGAKINIAFQFRNSKHPMNISGEIARSTQAGVGIKFLWA